MLLASDLLSVSFLFYIELPENCIYLNQSELSNFFMYIIGAQIGLVITNYVREFCYSFDY